MGTHPKTPLTPALSAAVKDALDACQLAVDDAGLSFSVPLASLPDIQHVWAFSDFISKASIRNPDLLVDLLSSGDLDKRYGPDEYDRRLESLEPMAGDPMLPLQRRLRRFRTREMIRIAWRDLDGRAELDDTLAELSALADACLDYALSSLYHHQCQTLGTPVSKSGQQQYLVVVGLGKLGGQELNFSSDIDLVFAYHEPGKTNTQTAAITNAEFFVKLCRGLIRALGEKTVDGIVYRVDMRLRPDGENGPLVMTFDNMEEYYQRHGREWERYAWIKARVVAGDKHAGKRLIDSLKPFVYRRYLDYGVFESLRDMKQKIAIEVKRKSLMDHIKLGPGGIREIEFFGQVFQLIRGGVTPELQERRIRPVLQLLVREGYIQKDVCTELTEAYHFLRVAENRLQEFNDQQTHSLPKKPQDKERLALSMGFENWDSFWAALDIHRQNVQSHFRNLLEAETTEPADCDTDTAKEELTCLWQDIDVGRPSTKALTRAGYEAPDDVLKILSHFKNSPKTRALSHGGRERIDKLIPLVLRESAVSEQPAVTVKRIVTLLEAVERRTNYMSLLLENPGALKHLIRLSDASPWIVTFLSRHPVLLDELLDARTLYTPPQKEALRDELDHRMKRMPENDLEYQMEEICIFRQVNTLRVAAADITQVLPLMKVSDYLSGIAEVILDKVVDLSWNHLTRRHGRPQARLKDVACRKGFAVIAYGKLGGLELGYGSDLDLVFIHAGTQGQTGDGKNAIDNTQFYSRLGQRVIHILSTHTPAGTIYEIDMRLRPSGSSGVLVSHFAGFETYQSQDAWTWEHQALLRSRAITGDERLMAWFEATRRAILTRRRDRDELRAEVVDMRTRMRASLLKNDPGVFDVKQAHGGIVDIEFLVQYLVLLNAHKFPDLVTYPDNVRQIRALEETGILNETIAYLLRRAYLVFRAATHQLNLKEQPATVPENTYRNMREKVRDIWEKIMVSDTVRD